MYDWADDLLDDDVSEDLYKIDLRLPTYCIDDMRYRMISSSTKNCQSRTPSNDK